MFYYFCFALLLLLFFKRTQIKGWKPKNYTKFKTSNRLKFKHTGEDYDAIVIGSGPSGLTTAALLAKINWKVLVLEQNEIIGGGFHTFKVNGSEFESGVHYIGNDLAIDRIFKQVCNKPIEKSQLEPFYDEVQIGNKSVKFVAGKWIQCLTDQFPDDRWSIIKFGKELKRINHWQITLFFRLKALNIPRKMINWFQHKLCPEYFKLCNETVYDVLHRCGIKPKSLLGGVLCGQYGDHGMLPSKAPFFIHAAVVTHYQNGAWFPKKGTQSIADSMIDTILKSGGYVGTFANVTNILHHNNQVQGVVVNHNTEVWCETIISSIGLLNTLKYNVPLFNEQFDIEPSSQFMFLFLTLDEDFKGLTMHNKWVYPNSDFDSIDNDMDQSELGIDAKNRPYFISSGSAKMKTDKNTLSILTTAKEHYYYKWNNPNRKSNKEYQSWKRDFSEYVIHDMEKWMPGISKHILNVNVASPLSVKDYLGYDSGCTYGAAPSMDRFLNWNITPRTLTKGLFLTGQDLITNGISGAVQAGELTANVVVNYGSIFDIITGSDLITDLERF
jgi:all-trans-retinol 13,14-reductase